MRLLLLSALLLTGLGSSLRAQTTVEGKVQLPAPSANFGFTQRYSTTADVPTLAVNPPAAIVYLEGDFGPPTKPNEAAVMAQKNQTFTPDLLAIPVGGTVIFQYCPFPGTRDVTGVVELVKSRFPAMIVRDSSVNAPSGTAG